MKDKTYIPLFFLTAFLFGEAMISFSLAITAIFNDSKFSTQIGFLTLFLPIFIYIGLFVFISLDMVDITKILYCLSWMPHFPCMRLMQLYLNSYFEKGKFNASVHQGYQFLLLLANIPMWFFIFVYLNSVLSIGKRPFFCCRLGSKKSARQSAHISAKSLNDLNDTVSTNLISGDDSIVIHKLCKSF